MANRYFNGRLLATLFALSFATQMLGQDAVDAVRPFYGNGGPGSRSEGLAQAFTAIADDAGALHYNPAGLAFQTNHEVNFGLNHLEVGTEGSGDNALSLSATRLGNLSVVIPGEGTKWTFAMGLRSLRSYERARKLVIDKTAFDGPISTETITEGGQLVAMGFGVGYQISPTLAVGGAVDIVGGSSVYDENITVINRGSSYETLLHIAPRYRGLSGKLGLIMTPNSHLRIGMMIQSPQRLNVTETSYDDLNPDEIEVEYLTIQSYQFRFGTALTFGALLLSADIFWNDFSQIRFESNLDEEFIDQDSILYYLPIDPTVNSALRSNYGGAAGLAVGGELLLPQINVKIRGGYRYQPSPKSGAIVLDDSDETARQTATAGISFLAGPGLKIDLTYAQSRWQRTLSDASLSAVNPLRSSASALTANFIIRL